MPDFVIEKTALQPEARVQAFIADYHRAHTLLGTDRRDPNRFKRWREMIQELDRAHFIEEAGREVGGSDPRRFSAHARRRAPC